MGFSRDTSLARSVAEMASSIQEAHDRNSPAARYVEEWRHIFEDLEGNLPEDEEVVVEYHLPSGPPFDVRTISRAGSDIVTLHDACGQMLVVNVHSVHLLLRKKKVEKDAPKRKLGFCLDI